MWSRTTKATPASERIAGPIPSQSLIDGLSGYSVVRTTYMFRNVATLRTTYAIRQRGEMAARMSPSAKNG